MKKIYNQNHTLISQNHGLNRLKDCTEFESATLKNPCNLRNPIKSVIQTIKELVI